MACSPSERNPARRPTHFITQSFLENRLAPPCNHEFHILQLRECPLKGAPLTATRSAHIPVDGSGSSAPAENGLCCTPTSCSIAGIASCILDVIFELLGLIHFFPVKPARVWPRQSSLPSGLGWGGAGAGLAKFSRGNRKFSSKTRPRCPRQVPVTVSRLHQDLAFLTISSHQSPR